MADDRQHALKGGIQLQAEFPEGTEISKQFKTAETKWEPGPKTGGAKGGLGSCSTLTLITSLALALVAGGVALYSGH